MSKEMLKDLIKDEPFPDEIKAIEEANKSIRENGTIPHETINWD